MLLMTEEHLTDLKVTTVLLCASYQLFSCQSFLLRNRVNKMFAQVVKRQLLVVDIADTNPHLSVDPCPAAPSFC